jgi:hypothetical protein
MVLTVAVQMGDERPGSSRRAVLRAALGSVVVTAGAAALGACDSPEPTGRTSGIPDPLGDFYRDTAALLARCEATIAAHPELADRLTPQRDDHRAHLAALAREIGPGLDRPSANPSANTSTGSDAVPVGDDASLEALIAAEKTGAASARAACLAGPSYRAVLLGSIAAARASHAEVLS